MKRLLHLGPFQVYGVRSGVMFIVGPWEADFSWGPGRYGWHEGDGPIVRFVRRWWTGWHRWGDEL